MIENRSWRLSAMLTGISAALLLSIGTAAGADANSGEYMGYRLGQKFKAPDHAEPRPHVAGPRVYDLFSKPRDHGAESMSIFVSPQSSIVGSIFGEWYFSSNVAAKQFAERYLVSLTRRYREWTAKGDSLTRGDYRLTVEVQQKSDNGDFWPSNGEYRVAASLIYAPDSLARDEWMKIVHMESDRLALNERQYRKNPIRLGKSRSAWSW